MIFVTSFTENGNLLSQWRGYCKHNQGVSLGFRLEVLQKSAADAKFVLGRCIYDINKKHKLARQVVAEIVQEAEVIGPDPKQHASQSFWGAFQSLEADLLRIAILIKNPAFSEEDEWRMISPVLNNYVEPDIHYRVGSTMLIPYLRVPLRTAATSETMIDQVYLGPTTHQNLAIGSLSKYLSRSRASYKVVNSQMPYRST